MKITEEFKTKNNCQGVVVKFDDNTSEAIFAYSNDGYFGSSCGTSCKCKCPLDYCDSSYFVNGWEQLDEVLEAYGLLEEEEEGVEGLEQLDELIQAYLLLEEEGVKNA